MPVSVFLSRTPQLLVLDVNQNKGKITLKIPFGRMSVAMS